MDGATLLHPVMTRYPDATRILLTGQPGRDAAIAAVNRANIFRFLSEACPPDQLRVAIEAGLMHYRLIRAERSILKETLVGCVQALNSAKYTDRAGTASAQFLEPDGCAVGNSKRTRGHKG